MFSGLSISKHRTITTKKNQVPHSYTEIKETIPMLNMETTESKFADFIHVKIDSAVLCST